MPWLLSGPDEGLNQCNHSPSRALPRNSQVSKPLPVHKELIDDDALFGRIKGKM